MSTLCLKPQRPPPACQINNPPGRNSEMWQCHRKQCLVMLTCNDWCGRFCGATHWRWRRRLELAWVVGSPKGRLSLGSGLSRPGDWSHELMSFISCVDQGFVISISWCANLPRWRFRALIIGAVRLSRLYPGRNRV